MRNILVLIILGLGISACESTTEGRVEGEPLQFQGSFLVSGENLLSTDNPNPLFDYADHMNIERTQIKEMMPASIETEVVGITSDSLLLESLALMITADAMDTLKIATLDEIQAGIAKHDMTVNGSPNVLPYLRADQPEWILNATLDRDFEGTVPFKVTMSYDVKYVIR